MLKLSDIGEIAMIRRLCGKLSAGRGVLVGPGDDCAVVRLPGGGPCVARRDLLLTSDPVIENVHFLSNAPAAAVGRKALGRALSDIAAMGGEPLWAVVDLVAPAHSGVTRLSGIYRGMNAVARRWNVSIVGGDVARGPALELHVFCVGTVAAGKAVLRSGAKPGDALFVTGSLGGSAAGRHLRFEPRIEEGRWLAARGWASAMIDVSDALASDLRRINERSGTGAELQLDAIPLSRAALKDKKKGAPLQHALSDGEDFELLFTVSARKARAFQAAWRRRFELPCSMIGKMTARRGVIECLDSAGARSVMSGRGYEHFGEKCERDC